MAPLLRGFQLPGNIHQSSLKEPLSLQITPVDATITGGNIFSHLPRIQLLRDPCKVAQGWGGGS